jgi:DNA-binding Xre family transcriptional regulator
VPTPKDLVEVDRLRDILSEKRLSQRELAHRADMPQSTVSYAVRAGTIRKNNARKIASALNVAVEDLSREGYARRAEEAAKRVPVAGEETVEGGVGPITVELGPESIALLTRIADALEATATEPVHDDKERS